MRKLIGVYASLIAVLVVSSSLDARAAAAPRRAAALDVFLPPRPADLSGASGRAFPVVLEVRNLGDASLAFSVPTSVVPRKSFESKPNVVDHRKAGPGRGWQLIVLCEMPNATGRGTAFTTGLRTPGVVDVKPDTSALVKVEVPMELLAAGTCRVQAVLSHDGERVAVTEWIPVECVATARKQ